MKYLSAIILVAVLLTVPGTSVMAAPGPTVEADLAAQPAGGIGVYPTFVITAVSQNNWVEIRTDNLPPNEYFTVTMNYMGTQGIGGTVVATTYSGAGGSITAKYSIPGYLYNQSQIAIRMVSQTSGYFAYNWFYNNNANVPGTPANPPAWYSGYPTFAIAAVQRDKNVTIAPSNFPPNDTLWVRLNWMHTQGIAGQIVQTVHTDANGNLDDITYFVPDFLKGSYQIAIRIESPTSGYFAYNWFYNNDAP